MMILITGCTGFVGAALARRLVADGKKVRGFARDPERVRASDFSDKFSDKVEWIRGSVLDLSSLEKAMKDVDQVIHLVGILLERGNNTFRKVHVEGTRNVVDIAKRFGVARYLHMSALGTRPDAKSRYHKTKWEAEEYVRQSGLQATIFRPSVIFGPEDNFVNVFVDTLKKMPFAPIFGNGEALMQPIWVEDVVHCLKEALNHSATVHQTYELGGPDQLTFEIMINHILKAMKRERVKIHLPFPFLKIQAAIMETFLPVPPFTVDQLVMAREDNICDNTLMREVFALEPRAFVDGLKDYAM